MEIKNLTKIFKISEKDDIMALDNVNATFEKGKMYAIIGESGAGKTTLINVLGLLDDYTSGEYIIDNKPINKLTEDEKADMRMKKFGFVFQSYYLNSKLKAYENVMIPMFINKDIKKNERKDKAISLLKQFGLDDRITHYPNQLSGGEQQRVAIARALANDPEVLIADEPTGNLDKENEKLVFDYLKKICKEGKCVIVVSHNMIVKSYADKIYYIDKGKLHEK